MPTRKQGAVAYLSVFGRLRRGLKIAINVVFGRTPAQRFFRYYLLIIILGAVLLYVPISLNTGYRENGANGGRGAAWSFMDALFTSASAFSDTGLVVSSVRDTFGLFGQIIIMILLQVGGIGVMTIKVLIWNLFLRRGETLTDRVLMQSERGGTGMGDITKMIVYAGLFVIGMEIVFGFALMVYFHEFPAYEQVLDTNPAYAAGCVAGMSSGGSNQLASCAPLSINSSVRIAANDSWATAAWWGFFHSVSAANNAGFDVMGPFSIAAYRNDGGAVVQVIMLIEFVIGGLGFPLLFDVINWIRNIGKGQRFRISLFTKVASLTYAVVALAGLGLSFGTEYAFAATAGQSDLSLLGYDNSTGAFGVNADDNKRWAIAFTSFSTRNAGYATVDPHILGDGTKFVNSVLMFIGASPSSTGGGIRVTTLAVIVASVVQRVAGRSTVTMFHRRIGFRTVRNAYAVLFVAAVFTMLAVLVVQFSPYSSPATNNLGFADSMFETFSAFGTTGLSTGLTPLLSWWSLLFLVLLMFMGQLGVSTTILSWAKKDSKHNGYSYPHQEVIFG